METYFHNKWRFRVKAMTILAMYFVGRVDTVDRLDKIHSTDDNLKPDAMMGFFISGIELVHKG